MSAWRSENPHCLTVRPKRRQANWRGRCRSHALRRRRLRHCRQCSGRRNQTPRSLRSSRGGKTSPETTRLSAAWRRGRPKNKRQSEIGRTSGRERVCKYVEISVVAGSLTKKHKDKKRK